MPRYIDVGYIINRITEERRRWGDDYDVEQVLGDIEDAPTIEAVHVVRCKDCKHCYVDGENVRYNVCDLNHNKVQADDWFCADAEKRENDDH